MEEYISKKYLYNILNPRLCDSRGAEYYAYNVIKNEIDHTPTEEIVHFKTSVWECWAGSLPRCPACGYEYTDLLECDNFCGNCGAIMRKEESNGRN